MSERSEHHQAIIDGVERVCSGFDDQYWSEKDQAHEFPWAFYDQMASGGWVGIAIPEQYGGGGQGIQEGALVLNRVAASGAKHSSHSWAHAPASIQHSGAAVSALAAAAAARQV